MTSFLLVPVIDLLGGQVVRAVRGQRHLYRPIESPLCRGSEPLAVASALCERAASDTLYVADLDALTGRDAQTPLLARLLAARPGLRVWLDGGFNDLASARATLAGLGEHAVRVRPVFGTESFSSAEAFDECFPEGAAAGTPLPEALLSLDRRQETPMDPAGAWTQPARWPRELIVMTLDRVGADAGPDLDTLAAVQARSPQAGLIGAGGIRSKADLEAAQAAGARGWLVASALHDLKLRAR
ncbi:HisA/HisF-related TIM barrel protein [Azohydromonas caseinilytica]|uniref:Nickel transporter n=1 Tax=Azohydromonas caseinilytica TaxID=2728836 RepID=A0A848F6V4_9BURK|nr:HisA/HisF-related TIM barrel protein [Azohydromonas caseinilytica]NML15837.1 nickel transporter [Azohydromonas caseinilytica]